MRASKLAHCGRKIIVEIHHPALMSSSAEGGGATRVEYGGQGRIRHLSMKEKRAK